jgi:hypothetical protein
MSTEEEATIQLADRTIQGVDKTPGPEICSEFCLYLSVLAWGEGHKKLQIIHIY